MMIDFACACGHRQEHFFHATESQTVEQTTCDRCGGASQRVQEIVKAPAVVWTGPINSRYRDRDKEGYYGTTANGDGMVQYTRNTPDGKPKPVYLEDWSAVKNFCKSEGLVDPRECGRNMTVGEDGKQLSYDKGAPGTEV